MIPIYTINADDSYHIGHEHGLKLKKRIKECIKVYCKRWNIAESEAEYYGSQYREIVKKLTPNLYLEIKGIAKGSNSSEEIILALNARTEIMQRIGIFHNECSTISIKENQLMGMNWDWVADLEGLSVFLKIINKKKPNILMLAEPGIVGKVGINDHGIGVTLNILKYGKIVEGLPVHLLLRKLLESKDDFEVKEVVKNLAEDQSSNINILTRNSNFNLELLGKEPYVFSEELNFCHTNHSIYSKEISRHIYSINSIKRLGLLNNCVESLSNFNTSVIFKLLEIQEPAEVFRKYKNINGEAIGTIISMVFDLKKQSISFKTASDRKTITEYTLN